MTTVRPFDGDIEHASVPPEGIRDSSHPVPVVFLDKTNDTSDHITSSAWLKRWIRCDFPLFSNEIMETYHEHNVTNINPFIFIPIILLYNSYFACRSGLVGVRLDGDVNHILIIVAIVLMFIFTILFGMYVITEAFRVTGRNTIIHLKSQLAWLPLGLEDTLIFLGLSQLSLFLIARVLKGQCPPGTSLWEQQTCNQFASSGGIPTELAHALYMAPLVFPFSADLSICTVVISQLFTLSVVLFCVIYANAWSDYYVVLNWFIFSNFSFEFVRLQRIAFKESINAKHLLGQSLKKAQEVHLLKQEQERLRQEQILRDVKATSEAAQLVLAEEAKRSSEALNAKCSLVRHIGHEIRTPLNVIGVGVDMLLKELEPHAALLPDGIMETIEGIQDASIVALEVINELLMFEKLAAGMTTLECVPTPVVPFLEQAMKQHLLPARSKEIVFELVPSSLVTSSVTIDVDPIKLVTVFRNLFSNAIKFTKKQGRVTVRVDIKHKDVLHPIKNRVFSFVTEDKNTTESSSTLEYDTVEVTVKDTGAGLSAANLRKLFGEGVQFNANTLQGGGGSGLGLFITKGIVELHKQGKIWAESEGEGFGCTFFVQLPLYSLSHASTPFASASAADGNSLVDEINSSIPSNQQSPRTSLKKNTTNSVRNFPTTVTTAVKSWKPTILVVDDSGTNRKMLVRSLNSTGLFTCREAEDGVECLSIITLSMNARQRKTGSLMQRFSRKETVENGGSPRSLKGLVANAMQQQRVVIDAVLIDSNMPRMNGSEAIIEMRKIGYEGIIIGVSGGDDETMRQFIQAGADDVMQKPAKTDHLVKMLMDGLRKSVQAISDREAEKVGGGAISPPTNKTATIATNTNNSNPSITTLISTMAHISRLRKFIADNDDAVAVSTATADGSAVASVGINK